MIKNTLFNTLLLCLTLLFSSNAISQGAFSNGGKTNDDEDGGCEDELSSGCDNPGKPTFYLFTNKVAGVPGFPCNDLKVEVTDPNGHTVSHDIDNSDLVFITDTAGPEESSSSNPCYKDYSGYNIYKIDPIMPFDPNWIKGDDCTEKSKFTVPYELKLYCNTSEGLEPVNYCDPEWFPFFNGLVDTRPCLFQDVPTESFLEATVNAIFCCPEERNNHQGPAGLREYNSDIIDIKTENNGFQIFIKDDEINHHNCRVYNTGGTLIAYKKLESFKTENIQINNLTEGLYFINIESSRRTITKKFFIGR